MLDSLILGAGPYGLSLGAHLRARRTEFRLAGAVMGAWINNMPEGMYLKSEGFALDLFEPSGRFTLGAFCQRQGIPYADTGVPISKDTFIAYGRAFQKLFVPQAEERRAVSVTRIGAGFRTLFEDGIEITSRRLVVAAGVGSYARIPQALQALPPEHCSHSSHHGDFAGFEGKAIVVVGGGSSAMDTAAALHRRGARVTVIARRREVSFQTPLGARSAWDRARAPMTTLGPGWKSVLCTQAPLLFHCMPDKFRTAVVTRYLGPAPGWVIKDEVEGHVPIVSGTTVSAARLAGGRVNLTLNHEKGPQTTLVADHVVCATGFKIEVGRTGFLAPELASQIRHVDGAPKLSSRFESSVPGLYFIGPVSANAFGPMLRFACGAGFTARRLSRHIAALAGRVPQAVGNESYGGRAMAVDA
ncbi:MAG TPA: NAD(P)-binding domain-containing protein [Acidisoma sp.]|uniref:NAD(P)-binding domain-containing protein n=1 Tax=Acidisoma sp. TaxID=1872115 RepID=UPI002D14B51B|nr:NAD(P)-binding domain-containing protein [Acidisoma sp.]HTH99436.1 NAD(P)-binding domain-containing protein [Acidisoma sp.]